MPKNEVRLIDAAGVAVGIVSLAVALDSAREAELDLVEISPNAEPPVCRVMDHNKFLYEVRKKRAIAKKKQKHVQIKEIKIRPGTEEGDYQVKLRNLVRFLEDGDKVKITLRFRGREISHQSLGLKMLQRIQADLGENAIVEQNPRMEGRQMGMLVAPKKK